MRTKSAERRQSILKKAKEVFQEQGYEGCSMSQIVERLGGSKATLYSYFPSKEELFKEVMLETALEQAAPLFEVAFKELRTTEDLVQGLKEFGMRHLAIITSSAPAAGYRMAIAEATRTDLGKVFYERGPKVLIDSLAEVFQRFIDNGVLRDENAELMAMHMKSLYESEVGQRNLLGVTEDNMDPASFKPIVERAVRVFMRAYGIEYGVW